MASLDLVCYGEAYIAILLQSRQTELVRSHRDLVMAVPSNLWFAGLTFGFLPAANTTVSQ